MSRKPNVSGGSITIDLRGIQEGTNPLVFDEPGGLFDVDPSAGHRLRGYRVEGTVARSGKDYRVRGSLVGSLDNVCDRCLSSFVQEIRSEVEVRIAVGEPGEGEGAAEGVQFVSPGTSEVDLTSAFREATLLAIPIKNVCRADCRGICPSCGMSRNEAPCTCDSSPSDPRWDALRGLSFPLESKE